MGKARPFTGTEFILMKLRGPMVRSVYHKHLSCQVTTLPTTLKHGQLEPTFGILTWMACNLPKVCVVPSLSKKKTSPSIPITTKIVLLYWLMNGKIRTSVLKLEGAMAGNDVCSDIDYASVNGQVAWGDLQ